MKTFTYKAKACVALLQPLIPALPLSLPSLFWYDDTHVLRNNGRHLLANDLLSNLNATLPQGSKSGLLQ
jgi:hypothetical protein